MIDNYNWFYYAQIVSNKISCEKKFSILKKSCEKMYIVGENDPNIT